MSKIIVLSVGRDFSEEDEIKRALNKVNYDGLVSVRSKVFDDLRINCGISVELIDMDWKDLSGSKNIKTGAYGQYNADAPLIAAQKAVGQATHYMKFDGGDYNINKLSENMNLELIEQEKEERESNVSKQYKF